MAKSKKETVNKKPNILFAVDTSIKENYEFEKQILKKLQERGNVDVLFSGNGTAQWNIKARYIYTGFKYINSIFKKKQSHLSPKAVQATISYFAEEVGHCPVDDYDWVISCFEPVSAWACNIKNKCCVGLGLHNILFTEAVPFPKETDLLQLLKMKIYCPTTVNIGLHYENYNSNVFTPIIRDEIRSLNSENKDFWLVWLPKHNINDLVKKLANFKNLNWVFFSELTQKPYSVSNIEILPYSSEDYIEKLRTCTGVIMEANFEQSAEALYLNKKLLVVYDKKDIVQSYLAAALKQIGCGTLKSIKEKNLYKIKNWIDSDNQNTVKFNDTLDKIVNAIEKQFTFNASDDVIEEKKEKTKKDRKKDKSNQS